MGILAQITLHHLANLYPIIRPQLPIELFGKTTTGVQLILSLVQSDNSARYGSRQLCSHLLYFIKEIIFSAIVNEFANAVLSDNIGEEDRRRNIIKFYIAISLLDAIEFEWDVKCVFT